MSWVFIATSAYLTEAVPRQAAGAFALGNLVRTPGAAVAAAVAQPLVAHMGSGWCFTGLALVNFFVVGGSVLLLRTMGTTWGKAEAAHDEQFDADDKAEVAAGRAPRPKEVAVEEELSSKGAATPK